MRGIVERTRVAVVEVAGHEENVTEPSSVNDTEHDITTDDEDGTITEDGMDMDSNHGRWEMEIARVYENTLIELGTSLQGSSTSVNLG